MQLTEEQVMALAPDDASRKAGRELSSPSKWVTKGANEQALWGECQGSGSKPYRTQVDLAGMAFKCSCPSRKFPCKHGIGLLILFARNAADFTTTEAPDWVSEWISKRETKNTATDKKTPVNEAAQAKRQHAREQSVEDGLSELLLWIKDIVRNGIVGIPEKDSSFFTDMARRMVDAKAPGLATLVKNAGNLSFYKEGWQNEFTDLLARMYLLIAGYTNKPAALTDDLRSNIGFTQSQEELREKPGIKDTWLVLSKQTETEDSLTVERNWLYGTATKQYALVLQFSVMAQSMVLNFAPGMLLDAELVFYPSAQPLRALIKSQSAAAVVPPISGLSGWQQVAELETAYNSALPFSSPRPFLLQQITPLRYEGRWWLSDSSNRVVQVKEDFREMYKLLSISGGNPLNLAVLGNENCYEPLGILTETHYISLSN
ncbi:SWIM zinc finger [Chitinophaga sp. YR573]|uniref:SWIM zinc finger family protein n=1 Tax=Chitinophaga sp. YR573 TaxID=1881040 RepID=UPI0008BD7AAD|nr:SWIM zinc finger family protein [Chitinophaga sp. YR573]SEV92302.1 SWIM zinc finger [Chitinophaga sp. YR573]